MDLAFVLIEPHFGGEPFSTIVFLARKSTQNPALNSGFQFGEWTGWVHETRSGFKTTEWKNWLCWSQKRSSFLRRRQMTYVFVAGARPISHRVGRSVGPSVTLCFFCILGQFKFVFEHAPAQIITAPAQIITAPAQLPTTGVVVLSCLVRLDLGPLWRVCLSVCMSIHHHVRVFLNSSICPFVHSRFQIAKNSKSFWKYVKQFNSSFVSKYVFI